ALPSLCRARDGGAAPPHRTRLSHVPLRPVSPGLQRADRHALQPRA
ncbi:MAG: hypothetical protein AVDCRST_MAG40-1217, partial [uncultured Gemmatimonadaceae bacterium]